MQPPTDARRGLRRDAVLFAAIASLAFALRFVYLLQARACPLFDGVVVDGRSYWDWSGRIVAGDWLGDRVFYQAPLYPYFLAVAKLAVGADLWNVRLVQIAAGAIACGILFLGARRFVGRPAAVAAGVLAACYPPAIFFDGCIQKVGLGFLAMAVLVLALGVVRDRPTHRGWLGAGAALGMLLLTREETILLVPVLGAWSLLAFREHALARRGAWLAAWAAGLALVLGPVAVRNAIVGGEFALTTSQAGPNFYIGNNPASDGTYVPLRPGRQNPEFERQDAFELAEQAEGRRLSPGEVSRHWLGRSLTWIRAEPQAWLKLLARKAALLANAYEVPDADDIYFYERYVSLLRAGHSLLHFGVLVPLAAAGVALTWRRRRELLALHLVLAMLCAGVVLFYVFARYRYPVVSLLLVFAGAALTEAAARVRSRDWRALAWAALAAVTGAALANGWRPWPRDHSLGVAWANAGIVQAERGDHAAAVELFQRAVAVRPTSPEPWGNLGLAFLALQRFDRAAEAFRRALELGPSDLARAHLRLGLALARGGRPAQALAEIDASLQRRPDDVEALGLRANALIQLRRRDEAVASVRQLLRIAPRDRDARLVLAWLLATSPEDPLRDGPAALELTRALDAESQGRDPRVRDVLAAALAEVGRAGEAAAIARDLLRAAEARGATAVAADWREKLARYERGEPWRVP